MRVVSQAGPIKMRTGVQPRTWKRQLLLQGRPMAMTFRKAGFID